jgi:hypothetical protein
MPVSLDSVSAHLTDSGRVIVMVGGDVHSEHKTANSARRWAKKMASIKGVDKLFYEHVHSIIPSAYNTMERSACEYEEGIRAVLRARMNALGLDFEQLASSTGLPAFYLRLLMNDSKPVQINRLFRVISALGIVWQDLWPAVDREIESWDDVRRSNEI